MCPFRAKAPHLNFGPIKQLQFGVHSWARPYILISGPKWAQYGPQQKNARLKQKSSRAPPSWICHLQVSCVSVMCSRRLCLSFMYGICICHFHLSFCKWRLCLSCHLSFESVIWICHLKLSFEAFTWSCHLYLSFEAAICISVWREEGRKEEWSELEI